MITDIPEPEAVPPLTAAAAHAQLLVAIEEAERATQSAVMLFIEIARRHLYRELNCPSMIHYATEALGPSPSRARYFLKLARDLEDLPAIREALGEGRIGWTHAVQVARVATPETESAWLEQAETSSRRELGRKIERARQRTRKLAAEAATNGARATASELPLLPLPESEPEPEPLPPAAVDVTFHLSPSQYARFQALQEKLRKSRVVPRGWPREEVLLAAYEELLGADEARACEPADREVCELAHTGMEASAGRPAEVSRLTPPPRWQVVVHRCEECGQASVSGPDGEPSTLSRAETERIACDSTVMHDDGTSRASIPPRTRRLVARRDGHRCTRCGATRFLEVHHLVPRAEGGGNAPENLVTLCSACHALSHEMGSARLTRHRPVGQTAARPPEPPG